jgi:flagellar biosynthesis GTPase FlhF
MNLVGVFSTAVLSLTLVAAVPVYAQQEQRDQQEEQKARPAQQEEKKAQPVAKQEEKNAQQQNKNTQQEQKNVQQQDRSNQSAEKNTQQQNRNSQQEEKNAQQQHTQQARPQQQEQRAGNNGGNRIPDDRYKANFGREHSFRVSHADYNSHRFQYGGYWFGFVDPWPSNWLYTQDVYVF